VFVLSIFGGVIERYGDKQFKRRIQPIYEDVDLQLAQRKHVPSNIWLELTTDLEFVRFLCRSLMERMHWSNDNFVPADPFSILAWSDHDGAVRDIEQHLGCKLSEESVARMMSMTLGEVVLYLAEPANTPSSVP
jgi:hypothetical protein